MYKAICKNLSMISKLFLHKAPNYRYIATTNLGGV